MITTRARHRLLPALAIVALLSTAACSAQSCAMFRPAPTEDAAADTRAKSVAVANAIEKVGFGLEGIQDLEIALFNLGKVTPAEHERNQKLFLTTATEVRQGIADAKAATSNPNLTRTVNTLSDRLTSLGMQLAVSNPEASKALTTAAVTLTSGLQIALLLLA